MSEHISFVKVFLLNPQKRINIGLDKNFNILFYNNDKSTVIKIFTKYVTNITSVIKKKQIQSLTINKFNCH